MAGIEKNEGYIKSFGITEFLIPEAASKEELGPIAITTICDPVGKGSEQQMLD